MKSPNAFAWFQAFLLGIGLNALTFPELAFSQFDTTTLLLTANSSFESEINGWHGSSTSAKALTRDWTPGQFDGSGVTDFTDNFFKGEKANLGSRLVEIGGSGAFGQSVIVNPSRRKHIFNAFASKQATRADTDPGYASVGIAYYDLNGVEVDHYEFPVAEPDANLNRGIGDGLNFYGWGIDAPSSAVSAYVFGYTSSGTKLQLDNLAIFEISNTVVGRRSVNLVANPDFSSIRLTSVETDPTCVCYGVEFWENNLDWSTPFDGGIGSNNQEEWVYQFVPLKPGATYSVLNVGSKAPETVASFGFDFYDKNWNPIGKRYFDLTGKTGPELGFRLEVPTACAHSSLFIWAAKQSPGEPRTSVLPLVYEQEPKLTCATTFIATRSDPVFSRIGQIGVSVEVIYGDRNGLDLSTLDISDIRFTSKTSTSKTYMARSISVTPHDRDRLARVIYTFTSGNTIDPAFADINGIRLLPQQVKDKLGNFAPAKSISPIVAP